MKYFFIIVGVIISLASDAQMDIVTTNYYDAYKVVDAFNTKYPDVGNSTYLIKLSGNEYVKSHSARPYLMDTCKLSGTLNFQKEISQEQFTIKFKGNDYTSVIKYNTDSSYFYDYGDTMSRACSLDLLALEYLYNPYNINDFIERNSCSLFELSKNKKEDILGFSGLDGSTYYCFFDSHTNLPLKIKKVVYDPIIGDTYDEIIYQDYKFDTKVPFPRTIMHKRAGVHYRELKITAIDIIEKKNASGKSSLDISMESINDNLFLLKLNNYNNKVLLLKAGNDIAIFDAPISFDICSALVDYIYNIFPNTTIKSCFVSHHHPDHAGGIAAFAKVGAKIVTTEGNYDFFRTVLSSTHTRGKGKYLPLSNSEKPLNLLDSVPLHHSKKFLVNNVAVIAYEHGSTTNHTDQFLSFYLPESKILFVGDLALFPKNKEIRQGERARSVLKLIKNNQLTVDKIITSWPLKDYKSFGTVEELEKSVSSNNVK
jgi:glyoxylase-like metal-dependent hydrolase (beta-lactamase superfamily II)